MPDPEFSIFVNAQTKKHSDSVGLFIQFFRDPLQNSFNKINATLLNFEDEFEGFVPSDFTWFYVLGVKGVTIREQGTATVSGDVITFTMGSANIDQPDTPILETLEIWGVESGNTLIVASIEVLYVDTVFNAVDVSSSSTSSESAGNTSSSSSSSSSSSTSSSSSVDSSSSSSSSSSSQSSPTSQSSSSSSTTSSSSSSSSFDSSSSTSSSSSSSGCPNCELVLVDSVFFPFVVVTVGDGKCWTTGESAGVITTTGLELDALVGIVVGNSVPLEIPDLSPGDILPGQTITLCHEELSSSSSVDSSSSSSFNDIITCDITALMTSATTPTPNIVTESDFIVGSPGWKAFNKTTSIGESWAFTTPFSNDPIDVDEYVQFDFGSSNGRILAEYGVTREDEIISWNLYGTNISSPNFPGDFTLLDSRTNASFGLPGNTKFFKFSNFNSFEKYRFRVLRVNPGGTVFVLRELNFCEIGGMSSSSSSSSIDSSSSSSSSSF